MRFLIEKFYNQDERQARHYERIIIDKHKDYSQCMSDIYNYHLLEGDNYGEVFKHKIQAPETERDNFVKRINVCKNITKNYWEDVFDWIEDHPNYLNKYPDKRYRFKSRYQRFTKLTEPLYFSDEDKSIFSRYNVFSRNI